MPCRIAVLQTIEESVLSCRMLRVHFVWRVEIQSSVWSCKRSSDLRKLNPTLKPDMQLIDAVYIFTILAAHPASPFLSHHPSAALSYALDAPLILVHRIILIVIIIVVRILSFRHLDLLQIKVLICSRI